MPYFSPLSRYRGHYAWVVVAITFLTVLVGAGIRAAPAVLIIPFETEFGWSRAAISSAVGLNLLLFGVAAPISGRLIDRYGPRLIMLVCLFLLASGVAGTLFMTAFWQMLLLWGILVGLIGGGIASVLVATVATRWFVARRGLALGILNSATSTGQLLFLPPLAALVVGYGWRSGTLAMSLVPLLLLPLIFFWMRNDPEEAGVMPYGASGTEAGLRGEDHTSSNPVGHEDPTSSMPLAKMLRHPVFWLLAGSFFICGGTSNGLIGTHLIPHSVDHGIPEVTAAATVGVMGAMNFVGTMLSGWLTDRIDARKILSFVFLLRGFSLFYLPFVHDTPGLFVFAIFYGLDWFATVPPIMAMTADTFGRRSVGVIYGWIFLGHQVGAFLMASGGGALRVALGDYQLAFLAGGILSLIGATLAWGLPEARRLSRPGGPEVIGS